MDVLIIFSILIAVFSWVGHKSFVNPVTIFCSLWSFIFILYNFKLLNYYDLTDKTIFIYYIQIFAFAIGSIIAKKFRIKFTSKVIFDRKCVENYRIIYVFAVVTILFLFFNSIEVIRNLVEGKTFYEITDQGDIIVENSSVGLTVGLKYLVVDPVTALISPLAASIIVTSTNIKQKRMMFICNIIIVLLHTFQHGGRDMLIVFVISYLFAYILYMKNKNVSLTTKLLTVFFVAVIILFSLWVSKSRGIENIWASMYYYLSGTVPHLETCIQRIGLEDMTFGVGMLYGILLPIVIGLRGFGIISKYPAIISQVANNYDIPTKINDIGNNVTINAHVGLSYYFYSEGGILFVFLGCLALGYASERIFNNARKVPTSRNISLCLMMMCVVVMSFIRFQLIIPMYALGILYLSTFLFKTGDVDNDNT